MQLLYSMLIDITTTTAFRILKPVRITKGKHDYRACSVHEVSFATTCNANVLFECCVTLCENVRKEKGGCIILIHPFYMLCAACFKKQRRRLFIFNTLHVVAKLLRNSPAEFAAKARQTALKTTLN